MGEFSPPELTETCRIVRQLARALQAAHDKGVIHRDLKPDNVFLVELRDEPSQVKLLDFGIAKLAKSDHRVEKTATGAIVGTPQYIAPEQAKGYAIDHRVDIYALGGILFELLSGRPPFLADNAMEIVAKHLMETPVRVSTLVPDVPPQLDELIDQMLAKQPDRRPSLARVAEVLDAIRGRASSQASRGDPSQPSVQPPSTSAPFPTPTAPAAVAVSRPSSDALPEPASLVRKKVPWIAIAGVPVAGLIAFLIVRALDSSPGEEPREPIETAAPPAYVPPAPEPAVDPGVNVEIPLGTVKAPLTDLDRLPVNPTPPPAVPLKARLRLNIVNATPATTVLIDGRPANASSLLPVGTHTVEIRSKGMVPQRFTVELGRAGVTRRVVLEPKERRPPRPRVVPDDDKGLLQPGTLRPRAGD